MTTPRTVTHSDGTTFSDGTGYAPADLLVSDEWPANPSALPVEHQVSVRAEPPSWFWPRAAAPAEP